MPNAFGTPEHWLERAEEARTITESLTNPQSKEAMLRIAKDYERIAEGAAQRAKGSPQSN